MAGVRYKHCKQCFSMFKRGYKRSQPSWYEAKYCSIECHGESMKESQNGVNNPNWKGGRRMHGDGYILIRKPNHHRTNCGGYVLEHILVAEKKLGRRLEPDEVVHHIDKDRANNHPDNLDVMSNSKHIKLHNTRHDVTEDKIILASLLFETKSKIAEFLGIDRVTLYNKIKHYKEKAVD